MKCYLKLSSKPAIVLITHLFMIQSRLQRCSKMHSVLENHGVVGIRPARS